MKGIIFTLLFVMTMTKSYGSIIENYSFGSLYDNSPQYKEEIIKERENYLKKYNILKKDIEVLKIQIQDEMTKEKPNKNLVKHLKRRKEKMERKLEKFTEQYIEHSEKNRLKYEYRK